MSGRQRNYLDEHLPQWKINIDKAPQNLGGQNPADWFDKDYQDYALEIGFGGGEHLLGQARRNPQCGFIGCEPFPLGVAKLLRGIAQYDLTNIRIHCGDGRDIIDALADKTLCNLYLLYPDPWHKKKHHKRRFINTENLAAIHRVLTPRGGFLFASDIVPYVDWTLIHIRASGLFRLVAQSVEDWQAPPSQWFSTRYEEKAQREGRSTTYLRLQKLGGTIRKTGKK
ncbi:MAG: tRNA (guanosine(46)-N7)-methyltransferase TrmB [Alphaproteobacteria bacterium]|nr:tRNA (guanosine(46)-N7)-methyltransferase TrmB [Alphaproteobacteria bacterium]